MASIGLRLRNIFAEVFHAVCTAIVAFDFRSRPSLRYLAPEARLPTDIGRLRFALVKQEVLPNLYSCEPSADIRSMVASSLKHSGPLALFTKADATFFIVHAETDLWCEVWKQKVSSCHQGKLEDYFRIRDDLFNNGEWGHTKTQHEIAVSAESVDWHDFDVIISIDIAVPPTVTRRFPRQLWCYYISEPCMPEYRRSQKRLVEGYDVFLNQRFEPPLFRAQMDHEIDFPYDLQHSGDLEEIFSSDVIATKRAGVFIESHSYARLSPKTFNRLEALGPIRHPAGSTKDVLVSLLASKYFVRLGGRRMWGNTMVEACCAGCLAIGNPGEFKNRSLFTRETTVFSMSELIERLAWFQSDSVAFDKALTEQQALLNEYCFSKPMAELLKKRDLKMARFRP